MAGALGVQLGGPSTYFGKLVDKPFIGDATNPLTSLQYYQAIRLLYTTSILLAAVTFGVLLVSRAGVWGLLGLVR